MKVKKVKVARNCLHDWQYRLEMKKMLEPDETEAVIEGRPSGSVYW